MECLLCKNEKNELAKAHIFPIGFFGKIETKGQVQTFGISGQKGRRLQKAIYDGEIVCHYCEHTILAPLDDYAIKVLRDKLGAKEIIPHPDDQGLKLYVFDNIDKRKLRQFFASILWRVSVSKQLELQNISVGLQYEQKIQHDLLHDGTVDYIDVVVSLLSDPMHNAFFLPYRKKINPIDYRRDSQPVNGWMLQLPNIEVHLSLDKRQHPGRIFIELTDKNGLLISTSIHPESDKYKFSFIEQRKNEFQLNQIIKSYVTHQHNKLL